MTKSIRFFIRTLIVLGVVFSVCSAWQVLHGFEALKMDFDWISIARYASAGGGAFYAAAILFLLADLRDQLIAMNNRASKEASQDAAPASTCGEAGMPQRGLVQR